MTYQGADGLAAVFDRYPFNSPWVRGLIGRYWLQTWFAIETFLALIQASMDTRYIFRRSPARRCDPRVARGRRSMAGGDCRQLLRGSATDAPAAGFRLPSCRPTWAIWALALVVAVGAVASVWILHLPWWWLLFPPLVQSVISGNVQSLLVPLILVGAGPVAALLKVYAAVPLVILGRWRALIVLAGVLLVTAPILPWQAFLANLDEIGARLSEPERERAPESPAGRDRSGRAPRSLGCGPRTRCLAGGTGDLARPAVLLRHARDADAQQDRRRHRGVPGGRLGSCGAVRSRSPVMERGKAQHYDYLPARVGCGGPRDRASANGLVPPGDEGAQPRQDRRARATQIPVLGCRSERRRSTIVSAWRASCSTTAGLREREPPSTPHSITMTARARRKRQRDQQYLRWQRVRCLVAEVPGDDRQVGHKRCPRQNRKGQREQRTGDCQLTPASKQHERGCGIDLREDSEGARPQEQQRDEPRLDVRGEHAFDQGWKQDPPPGQPKNSNGRCRAHEAGQDQQW